VRKKIRVGIDLVLYISSNFPAEQHMIVPVIVSSRSLTLIAAFVGLVLPGSTLS